MQSLHSDSPPARDQFPLKLGRAGYLFVSGGIGMTPILAMLRRLQREGVRARWVHLCRSPADLAFADSVAELARFHDVHVHHDSTAGGSGTVAIQSWC